MFSCFNLILENHFIGVPRTNNKVCFTPRVRTRCFTNVYKIQLE